MPDMYGFIGALLVLMIAFSAGCSSFMDTAASDNDTSPAPDGVAASYKVTLRQPDGLAEYVKMDTDTYNIGEVVEFTIHNSGSYPLSCAGNPPAFSVNYQTPHGTWATRLGPAVPNRTVESSLAPGTSTQVYRFVTESWEPGRYRIVHDCGVEREFLLRALPAASPSPSPAICPMANTSDATLWIRIDSIGDQYISMPFTIHGTTNLAAGEVLKYTILSAETPAPDPVQPLPEHFITSIQPGNCSINSWSAKGEIQAAGDFVLWIADSSGNVSAIQRFSVLSR